MVNQPEYETRLAELIWRTVKLRVSLLIFSILGLLLVWSALINGNQEAQKVDDKFCAYLVNRNNSIQKLLAANYKRTTGKDTLQPIIHNPEDICSGTVSRVHVEATRYTDEIMPLCSIHWEGTRFCIEPLEPAGPPGLSGILNASSKAFADYDIQRRAAYRLEIHLSSEYSGGSVEVNALSVAEVLPFCVFIVLAEYLILGFQETAYRAQLRALLKENNGESHGLDLARTQFFTGTPLQNNSSLTRHLILSPEQIATRTFLIVLLVLLVKVVSIFILNLVHLTDTIFLSYPFKLYFSVSVLILLLAYTRRSYFRSWGVVFPKTFGARAGENWFRHLNVWSLVLKTKWPRLFKLLTRMVTKGSRLSRRWLPMLLAAFGFVSLLLSWALDENGDPVKGLSFALRQAPEGKIQGFTVYSINPTVFNEIRFHICTALFFLLIFVLHDLCYPRLAKGVSKILHNTRTFLAVGTIFFSVNYLIYMSVLQYESIIPTPWPMDSSAYQGGSSAKGESMMFYNPTYGFWIFVGCCLVLAWISLTRVKTAPDAQP